MQRWAMVSLAGLAIVTAVVAQAQGVRSMQPDGLALERSSLKFDPAQSVALFVGASTFTEDASLATVPYAVDDAIDLAWTFSFDPRVSLVPPHRVVLALSNRAPRKPISRRRLADLKRHHAIVVPATQTQILKLLSQQAGAVGPNGIFIVSFAGHGFNDDGAQYILAANSLLREIRQTAIPAARVFDLVARSRAARSLILIDTCRERLQKWRGGPSEGASAAPLIQRMGLVEGQVVLYAASAGKWAYDDDLRQNGVFTGAVLDGLQCRAGHDRSGIVTIDMLSAAVEQSVVSWIRTNRDPFLRNATQTSVDGAARTMPVAICSHPPPVDPPPIREKAAVRTSAVSLRQPLEYCRDDGKELLRLYDSKEPDQFVTTYLGWRDGCVAVLRDLDTRLPQAKPETTRFLSVANFWCATKCPANLSPARCALFQENARAERCFWDLDKAVPHVQDILIRNAAALQPRRAAQKEQP